MEDEKHIVDDKAKVQDASFSNSAYPTSEDCLSPVLPKTKIKRENVKVLTYPLTKFAYYTSQQNATPLKQEHLDVQKPSKSWSAREKGGNPIKVCPVCGESYPTAYDFNEHLATHFDLQTLECQLCTEAFPTSESLMSHMQEHKKGPNKCPVCFTPIFSKDSFRTHLASHGDEASPFLDNFRDKKLSFRCPIERNMKLNLTPIYKCERCPKKFITETSLQEHVATHGARVTCDLCGLNCVNEAMYLKHCDQLHNVGAMNFQYVCTICNERFTTRHSLREHRVGAHDRLFTCALCVLSFKQRVYLRSHLYRHYRNSCDANHDQGDDKTKPEVGGSISCDASRDQGGKEMKPEVSGQSGGNASHGQDDDEWKPEVSRKRKARESTDSFACDLCGPDAQFATTGLFQRHLCEHFSDGAFGCGSCGKHFAKNEDLITHLEGGNMRILDHTQLPAVADVNPIQCKICGKALSSIYALRTHYRDMHKDKRPQYPCCFCDDAAFDDGASFLSHAKAHAEHTAAASRYECKECGKRMVSKSGFECHKLTHGKFTCRLCKRTFTSKRAVSVHSRCCPLRKKPESEGTFNVFECSQCGKRYMKQENLAEHMKVHNA